MVVSNIFYVHPYLGKIPILTNIFQRGWNHQLEVVVHVTGHPFAIVAIGPTIVHIRYGRYGSSKTRWVSFSSNETQFSLFCGAGGMEGTHHTLRFLGNVPAGHLDGYIVCEHFPRQLPSTPSCDFGILAPVDLSKMAKGSWDQLYMDQPWTLMAWKVSCIDRLWTLASSKWNSPSLVQSCWWLRRMQLMTEKTQRCMGPAWNISSPEKVNFDQMRGDFNYVSLATLAGWNTNLVTATVGSCDVTLKRILFGQKPFSCTRRCKVVKCYVYPASNMDKLKKNHPLLSMFRDLLNSNIGGLDLETLPSNITETLR